MKVTSSNLQNSFGKYLNKAMDGEIITVTKNNKRVATLVGFDENTSIIREEAIDYKVNHKVGYDQFMKLYGEEESESRYELINGVVYAMHSPLFPHQDALMEISVQFYYYFKGKKCKPMIAPFDVYLDNGTGDFDNNSNVVQPDLLVMCDTENIEGNGKYKGVPSLVIEVLSPATKSKDLFTKSTLYMNSGVKEYWIVDTVEKQITVYHFEEKKVINNRVFNNGENVTSFIFDGLIVDVKDVF